MTFINKIYIKLKRYKIGIALILNELTYFTHWH